MGCSDPDEICPLIAMHLLALCEEEQLTPTWASIKSQECMEGMQGAGKAGMNGRGL